MIKIDVEKDFVVKHQNKFHVSPLPLNMGKTETSFTSPPPSTFCLRFQEIAGSLEEKLTLPLLEATAATGVGGVRQSDDVRGFPTPPPLFKLELFQVLWRSLGRCWKDGVFILALVHRFWKLSLQVTCSITYTLWVCTRVRHNY